MPTFIEANRLYYAFDIAPGFWTWLGDPPRDRRGRPNRRHS